MLIFALSLVAVTAALLVGVLVWSVTGSLGAGVVVAVLILILALFVVPQVYDLMEET